jgi:hypothetical protein
MMRWWTALAVLFLSVFAVVALSGPGRIDIVDGQTRYEVARSLVEHGDTVIRDPRVWFAVFPGRDGQRYTKYRLPQSAAGAVAILVADATGPDTEARRHFFFSLTPAVASALIAVAFAALFRRLGHRPYAALLWGAAGVLCTPCWFYGTSTFDDILGAAAVVLATTISLGWCGRPPLAGAVVGGLMVGLAYHCKQPLGLFVLPVLGANGDRSRGLAAQLGRLLLILALCLSLIAACQLYDLYKFPPGATQAHAEMMKAYVPVWTDRPQVSLLALSFSLSAGFVFYNPVIVLSIAGWNAWRRTDRDYCDGLTFAIGGFVLIISFLTFFKGDPAWGPRYLTPVFAVLWIFAPAGARLVRRWVVAAVLTLGLIIQLGALCIDPHRLYVEKGLPSGFYVSTPELYFHPALSHLLQRPREILDAWNSRHEPAPCFTPAPTPTFAFPVLDFVERGPESVQKYQVLKGTRFWWWSYAELDRPSRPVVLENTAVLLVLLAAAGLAMQVAGAGTGPLQGTPTAF